jgi:acetamidase/formamidase
MKITTPRALTQTCWLTFGFDESLNVAAQTALEGMLDLMVEQYGLTRPDALALASVVMDLRITQIANKVFGVHAVLPHDAWQKETN